LVIVTLVALGGCVSGRAAINALDATQEWPKVLARTEAAALSGRYGEAERWLTDFAIRYPGTDEAQETVYWRAVLKLDPANRDGGPALSRALLDSYLRAEGALQHRTEAEVLRQLAVRLDTIAPVASPTGSQSSLAAAPADRAAEIKTKDAEIQKLKEELAKANDELERIKKRLAQPIKP
jgi:TolA-binding protein